MKVRLTKKWREWPIGRVIEVADPKAKQLIYDQYAEEYKGDYPPKEKMKTEFFKPKNKKRNDKD